MEQTHGTWGDRVRIFHNDSCLVTHLTLKPHKRCSWHSHKTAYNLFYVLQGLLGVKTEDGLTWISPGGCFNVEPGKMHEFQTNLQTTNVIEIAYTKYNEHDILRDKLGGDLDECDEQD